MENLKVYKQKLINDYFASIDFTEINIDQLKNELGNIIGEKPAIRLNYKREEMINEEGTKTGKKLEKIQSITVIFTYEKDIDGKPYTFPSEETFIIA